MMSSEWRPGTQLKNAKAPLLVVVPTGDDIIPPSITEDLVKKAGDSESSFSSLGDALIDPGQRSDWPNLKEVISMLWKGARYGFTSNRVLPSVADC